MRPQTKKILDNIVDTMTGADGGVSFIMFRNLLEIIDKKAAENAPESVQIITIVGQFNRLIELANKAHQIKT